MSSLHPSYRVNAPTVVAQTIDQQTIIIHFDTGMYYSTNPTGAIVWSLIENGAAVDQIVDYMRSNYAGNSRTIGDGVASFLQSLETEHLIVGSDSPSPPAQNHASAPTDPPEFVSPVLQKYADMAELLLLDPVHEIEDRARRDA